MCGRQGRDRDEREKLGSFKDSESVRERVFKDFPTVTHSVPWKAYNNNNSQVNLSCLSLVFSGL